MDGFHLGLNNEFSRRVSAGLRLRVQTGEHGQSDREVAGTRWAESCGCRRGGGFPFWHRSTGLGRSRHLLRDLWIFDHDAVARRVAKTRPNLAPAVLGSARPRLPAHASVCDRLCPHLVVALRFGGTPRYGDGASLVLLYSGNWVRALGPGTLGCFDTHLVARNRGAVLFPLAACLHRTRREGSKPRPSGRRRERPRASRMPSI